MQKDPRVPGWAFKKHLERSIVLAAIALLAACIVLIISPNILSIALLILCITVFGVIIYFFRDPDRGADYPPNLVFSPGDGVVKDITPISKSDTFENDLVRIGIFLSVFDVHVQRAPLSGDVVFVIHQPGKNHPAYHPDASLENDQIIMGLNTEYGMVMIKQISGILARKCINYARPGDQIQTGERYGLIKFGSRVELFLPSDVNMLCSVGDKVYGGVTALAKIIEERFNNE